jgi:hypothetical protein
VTSSICRASRVFAYTPRAMAEGSKVVVDLPLAPGVAERLVVGQVRIVLKIVART